MNSKQDLEKRWIGRARVKKAVHWTNAAQSVPLSVSYEQNGNRFV
ncbi:uncharacterized protein G2W53_002714 [Senna tora]|uniref:Uncharacterized protein n=1 Tax=Senna tora TaxID=362788 RepID=A0A835CF21_9FABA|nr:uncharacterized protein G2W53_002714 [Senna tora]